ncbi:MAG: hypothetical protein ACKOAY_06680 [Haliscomenobacter sp.]
MRRLIIPALLLGAFALLSFRSQPGSGVTRLGATLYQVAPGARVNAEDKQAMLNTIKKAYNLTDLQLAKEITLKPIPYESKKGKNPNWVLETKAFMSAVETKFIHFDNKAPEMSPDLSQMSAVLGKYAAPK